MKVITVFLAVVQPPYF